LYLRGYLKEPHECQQRSGEYIYLLYEALN
jgi:hypothetical protein